MSNCHTGTGTFFIECTETASVLQNATLDSLVILDQLGHRTSTFDGYAIAYALLHTTTCLQMNLLLIRMSPCNTWPALLSRNLNAILEVTRSLFFYTGLPLEHVQRATDCKWH